MKNEKKKMKNFLNLAILTTDPALQLFHVKDYYMTKFTIPNLLTNGVT